MNPDLLKYYITLQPKFREVMGPIIVGDLVSWINSEITLVTTDFQAKCATGGNGYTVYPRTIDDSSEEARKRSLIGMLTAISEYRVVLTELTGDMWHCCLMGEDEQYIASTLTEAILKALCAQWDIEV